MIILVRHGEATHHTEHLTGGWTDSTLTGNGKQQMEIVAKILAKDFRIPCLCKLPFYLASINAVLTFDLPH